MKFHEFLKDKTVTIITNTVVFGILAGNLKMFGYSSYLIYLCLVGWLVATFLPIGIEYAKKRQFYHAMELCITSLEKKYILCELLQRPSFIEGRIVYDGLQQINQNMMDEIKEYRHSVRDYKEYIEMWVHEVKTPVTNALLLTENNPNNVTKSIGEEIEKIAEYIEQTLYYSKMSLVEKDYVIANVSLDHIVKKAVRHNKKTLIGNKVQVKLHDVDLSVKTDEKWLLFVLNQIITNSVKYRREKTPILEFYAKQEDQKITLYIVDNGIGIKENELTKVLQKGFVGTNGRKKEATTGMGLYICNKLLLKMHHSIAITSKEGCYTSVAITFPNTNFFLTN